jgi:nucleoside-diphosphate-sugar epimerase
VQGTQHVLRAAIATAGVQTVVMTSSVAAVYVTKKPADHFYTEGDWSDISYIRETKQHYAESKLLAEMEAWRIFKEELSPERRALRLSTVCPTQTVGPLLQPTLNTSCSSILDLLNGSKSSIPNKAKCFVDVR